MQGVCARYFACMQDMHAFKVCVRACKACVKVCVREGREGRRVRVQGVRACKASGQGVRACVLKVCVRARRVQGLCACMQGARACKACVPGVRACKA